jgi:hypothetical protein
MTQNLRMDAVLHCVLDLIPYDSASVILTENDGRLFVAREVPLARANKPVVTLEVSQNTLLQRVLLTKKCVYLADTREEADWRETKALANIRSWKSAERRTNRAVELPVPRQCLAREFPPQVIPRALLRSAPRIGSFSRPWRIACRISSMVLRSPIMVLFLRVH